MVIGRTRGVSGFAWSAWAVHAYTASGAVLAFLAAREVFGNNFRGAFLWLLAAVLVDATDGWLARWARVQDRLPQFSGRKLDDLVDYLTFVFVPALLLWRAALVPPGWGLGVIAAVLLSSAYGFSREAAKTVDHFFTGFPSYWNVAALYLYAGGLGDSVNAVIVLSLAAMVFVPVGYVYPTRTPALQSLTLGLVAIWTAMLLFIILGLPHPSPLLVGLSLLFPVYYTVLSVVLHGRRETVPSDECYGQP